MTGKIRVEGKVIAVTGRVPGMRRKALERAIESSGGAFKKSVSRSTDLLVCAIQRASVRHKDGRGLSKKEQRTAELGVPCIKWDDFLIEIEYDLEEIAVQLMLFKDD